MTTLQQNIKLLTSHIASWGTVLLVTCVMVLPTVVSAAYSAQPIVFDPNSNVERNTGLGNATPTDVTAGIINWILGILAIIAFILVIYGGFIWLFSRGNEEEIQKAKDILYGALFGLIIILASYGITQYVFSNLVNVTTNGTN